MTAAPDLRGTTSHSVLVDTAPDAVYALLADAARWPEFFGPSVHIEAVPLSPGRERLRVWAQAGDAVKAWESERDHAADRRSITFRQVRTAPPITAMAGRWSLSEDAAGTAVTLDHAFAAESPEALAWITRVTDENSRSELGSLADRARRAAASADRRTEFEDAVEVAADAEEVRRFLWDGARWPDVLPHVVAATVEETGPGAHTLTMTTDSEAGRHRTSSTRVLLPDGDIVYKQSTLPPLLDLHLGRWRMVPTAAGTRIVSRHLVRLREGAEAGFKGDVRAALAAVRHALGRNSLATLAVAHDRLGAL